MQSLCLTFALSKLALTSLVLVLATAAHCTGRLIEKRSTGQQIKTIVWLFLAWRLFALSPEQFDVRFLGLKKIGEASIAPHPMWCELTVFYLLVSDIAGKRLMTLWTKFKGHQVKISSLTIPNLTSCKKYKGARCNCHWLFVFWMICKLKKAESKPSQSIKLNRLKDIYFSEAPLL